MNIFPRWAYNAWDIYQTIINFNSFDLLLCTLETTDYVFTGLMRRT